MKSPIVPALLATALLALTTPALAHYAAGEDPTP